MSGRMTTDFLDILCELQPDRFMKNILYNPLCELYDLYEANGCSEEWFIEYMYSGISVHYSENRGERIYVQINQSYHHTIFVCMLHYLHYEYEDMKCNEMYGKTINDLKEKYGKKAVERGIKFKKLREDALYDEVKQAIKWVTQRMNYVFEELDKIDINTFGKKRKFESMLDEL